MKTLTRLAAAFAVAAPFFTAQPADADFLRDATRQLRDVNRLMNELNRTQRNVERFGHQPAYGNQRQRKMRACEDKRTGQVFVQPRCDRRYERDRGPVQRVR